MIIKTYRCLNVNTSLLGELSVARQAICQILVDYSLDVVELGDYNLVLHGCIFLLSLWRRIG